MKGIWDRWWPCGMTAVIGLGLWTLSLLDVDWSTWRPATCMPVDCFCEAVGEGFVRQPANAWSNLAFVLAGLFIVRGPTQPQLGARVLLRDDGGVRMLYGMTCVAIGVGSWLYHASLSFVGQWLDVLAMYLLPSCLALVNLVRVGRISRRTLVPLWLTLNAVLGGLLYLSPLWRRETFVALVLAFIASEVWSRRRLQAAMERRFLVTAVAAIVLAITIWILDLEHILCWPDSLIQGHSAWHVLCSLAAWWIYRYYASEHPVPTAPSHDHGTSAG